MGWLVTGVPLLVALAWGRCATLKCALLASWLAGFIAGVTDATLAVVVFVLAVGDLIKAILPVFLLVTDPARSDVRMVGLLSLALFPAHFVMSATHGGSSWFLYASAVNAVFVLQCLIVRGWADELVCAADRFFVRVGLVPSRGAGGA